VAPVEAWAWGRAAVKVAAKVAGKVAAAVGKVKMGMVADSSFFSLPQLSSGLHLSLREGIKGHLENLSAFLE